MFWSGNYIVVRQLNFLLKEKNVTLTQVLEADDILQECKADNLALIQFLTKPEILAELVTLITEEPPRDVELASQYRHASVACEVLTSHLSMLSDRLSSDVQQMNRLCDFINRHPPLNPLLASYFSKTIEMLLERGPKQDWYLYHIVCLRVLDFLKARRDFLPNLLRHISTSAIADIFKYFIRLDDLFNKVVMEWLEEHQFLESLIQIICGTYSPGELAPSNSPPPPPVAPPAPPPPEGHHDPAPEVGQEVLQDKRQEEQKDFEHDEILTPPPSPEAVRVVAPPPGEEGGGGTVGEARDERIAMIASANAAALLCDIIMNDCSSDLGQTGAGTECILTSRVRSAGCVRLLLQSVFTSPAPRRKCAIVHGARVLAAMTHHEPILPGPYWIDEGGCEVAEGGEAAGGQAGGQWAESRSAVELAVAPHLPLLHQALLKDPESYLHSPERQKQGSELPAVGAAPAVGAVGAAPAVGAVGAAPVVGAVGAARIEVSQLLAQLAVSEVEEVATTMLTLGTPGVLLDLFLRYTENNFLHAAVLAFVTNALQNRLYQLQYAKHLIWECDILTRLMDVFEENENNNGARARSGHMGHVTCMLRRVRTVLAQGPLLAALSLPSPALAERWERFLTDSLQPKIDRLDKPLGGYYPSENIYEVEGLGDTIGASYEFNELSASADLDEPSSDEPNETVVRDVFNSLKQMFERGSCYGALGGGGPEGDEGGAAGAPAGVAELEGGDGGEDQTACKNTFLELVSQRYDDNCSMWDDQPDSDVTVTQEGDEGGEALPEAGELDADPLRGASSPWDSASDFNASEAGWAQFESKAFNEPVDPFSVTSPGGQPGGEPGREPGGEARGQDAEGGRGRGEAEGGAPHNDDYWSFGWTNSEEGGSQQTTQLEHGIQQLNVEHTMTKQQMENASVELANNLLTAMSAMTPEVIANIVNANMTDSIQLPLEPAQDPTIDKQSREER